MNTKSNTQQRHVSCENGVISYQLTRKKVKNVNLRVRQDGKVLVSADSRVPIAFIDNFIKQRQEFIFAALAKYEGQRELHQEIPKQYISGERYVLLGKSLQLKVEKSDKEAVYTDDIYIYLIVRDPDNFRHKKNMMTKWLEEYQATIFQDIIFQTYKMFQKYDVPFPVIKVRNMKSRWGSCQPQKGVLTLNSRLIKAPESTIEYVVLHEFAHFIHPNHSQAFWDFVTMMMPDWKERRKGLEHI